MVVERSLHPFDNIERDLMALQQRSAEEMIDET
ncbi:hypothetical protein X739_04225 [Mesorhizobium sp. LNHC220B00]|nr:hypothetical protein X739_04225 [Mesorhizobium sp. LNHC220B00]ESY91480.1 hypothetical protein X741_22865 [Mesorhizobium sp. LNHC229A00]